MENEVFKFADNLEISYKFEDDDEDKEVLEIVYKDQAKEIHLKSVYFREGMGFRFTPKFEIIPSNLEAELFDYFKTYKEKEKATYIMENLIIGSILGYNEGYDRDNEEIFKIMELYKAYKSGSLGIVVYNEEERLKRKADKFIKEIQVVFKDKYTVLISYMGNTREINQNEELLIDQDDRYKIIPDKLIIDICKSNDDKLKDILSKVEEEIFHKISLEKL